MEGPALPGPGLQPLLADLGRDEEAAEATPLELATNPAEREPLARRLSLRAG